MTIEILEGQSKRLYSLVAPLVMNRDVLRQNNYYPFWTSPTHIWFLALDKKNVKAFFPVEITQKGEAKINNYYMAKADKRVFKSLIKEITAFCHRKYTLTAVALMQHKDLFESVGFQIAKEWKLYVKMEYHKPKRAEKTGKKK